MNRRRVLGATGALAAAGLSGCLGGFQEHFQGELRSPLPIEIYNEGERAYNVQLEAYERSTDRQTYDESYAVRSGERIKPPNLEGIEQRFRVIRFDSEGDEDLVETGAVTPDTQLVRIVIHDDDLLLDITENEDAEPGEGPDNGSATDGNESTGGSGSAANGDESNESDDE